MARDASFFRRRLARAFIDEAFELKLNPPAWSLLSDEQADEYLSLSLLSLRAQLQVQSDWAGHRDEGVESVETPRTVELAS